MLLAPVAFVMNDRVACVSVRPHEASESPRDRSNGLTERQTGTETPRPTGVERPTDAGIGRRTEEFAPVPRASDDPSQPRTWGEAADEGAVPRSFNRFPHVTLWAAEQGMARFVSTLV